MIKLSLSLIPAVMLFSCGINTSSEVSQNNGLTSVTEYGSPSQSNLLTTVDVKHEADVKGLWTGSFDQTAAQEALEKRMWESDEYSEFDGSDFYKKLSPEEKKLMEKSALFGVWQVAPPNKLSLIIESFVGGNVKGKSICAGNERHVSGNYKVTPKGYEVVIKEPGDDKYDGEFTFTIEKDSNTVKGSWKPFSPTTTAKTFTLKRGNFEYKPEASWVSSSNRANWKKYEKEEDNHEEANLNASIKLLTAKDVENQPKGTLRIARNAIYARHGYSFKVRDIRNYFDGFDDYYPVTTDVRDKLTDIEKKNEELLKRYEDYATEYYDEFGR